MRKILALSILVTTLLFIGQITLRAVGGLPISRDPFAPYEEIMPGQPSDALQHYPCHWRSPAEIGQKLAYCQFKPETGPFRIVTVEYDAAIRRIGFVARPGAISLGDLMQCWGKPISIEPDTSANSGGLLNLHWGKMVSAQVEVTGLHYRGNLTYVLPITSVSIDEQSVSCSSSQ